MPTYDYLCRQCGDRFEVVQSFQDDALTQHDVCGGALRKVFHARGVVFKGSGFYVTDSRKPNPANGKPSSTSDKDRSAAAKSDSAKSDGAKSDGAKKSKSSASKTASVK